MKERAEILIQEIDSYVIDGLNNDIKNQLIENKSIIETLLLVLSQSEFSVSFIGKIGVGKTSAICKAAGLQYLSKNKELVDVLKTGAGRTTVCEVRIEYAKKLSIKVEPLPIDEVKALVRNFSEFIWNKANKHVSDEEEGGNLLSEELTRCIRNMLGLTIEKKKGDNGKWKSTDKAIEFSKECSSVDEVNNLMYECLDLENRTEIELWPSQNEVKDWQLWLKDNFSKINDGKHKNVTIPLSITIAGEFPLKRNECVWKLIDTRGVDSNIHREDIRLTLDTEGVFPVICSSFVDAPDSDSRSFYDLGIKLGLSERIARDVTILILDKNESDKISDIDEEIIDLSDRKGLGRSIREEQVTNKIFHEYKILPNIETFDSKLDSDSLIWEAVEERKAAYLKSKENTLNRVLLASKEMISAETDKISSFNREVEEIKFQWRKNADVHTPDWKNFGNYISGLFSRTHHRTLAASINRNGTFINLDIYEAINQLARSNSVLFCKTELESLQGSLEFLKEKYPEFSNQLDTIEYDTKEEFHRFSVYVGNIAKDHWIERVKSFLQIWQEMDAEWGMGSGYKSRVLSHWAEWIKSEESIDTHNALLRRIASSWGRVLADK
jgi:hypothetical protein